MRVSPEFISALISLYGACTAGRDVIYLNYYFLTFGLSDWAAIQEQHPSGLGSWMAVMKWNADEFYFES